VGDWTGLGSGALRPNMQYSDPVLVDDAAAARADRLDVDHRNPRRNTVAELLLLGEFRFTVEDHRHVKTRDTHVGRNHVVLANLAADPGRCDGAAGWARQHAPAGVARGIGYVEDTAVREHDPEGLGITGPAKLLVDAGEIAMQQRLQIGVNRRRTDALE